MADCNPPDPPPLLKEPLRKLPTAADRNAADRAEREAEEDRFWDNTAASYVTGGGWGCLILIAIGLAAAAALALDPDPWSTGLAALPATNQNL